MRVIVCVLFFLYTSGMVMAQCDIVTDKKNDKPMLIGFCQRKAFSDTSFSQWWDTCYSNYEPDIAIIDKFADQLRKCKVTIVMGTWCSDSREQVPRFMKILDIINVPPANVSIICVDRDKKGLGNDTDSLNIKLVPVLILFSADKEIGRITETPLETLEKDILAVFSKQR